MRRPLFMVALFLVAVAAVLVGTGWAAQAPYGYLSTEGIEAGKELTVTGQVYQKDEKNIYLKSVLLLTSDLSETDAFGQSAVDSRQEVPLQENIICETEEAQGIPLGSFVAVEGQFSPYSHATNPGEFDAAVYYRTVEVGGKLRKAALLARGEEYWPIRESLYGLKCYFKDRLYRIFPEKEAAVMSALLLGDKSELDSDLKELYKRNGVLHILSISSLHITIIGMTIYKLLRRTGMPICPCALGGSLILILYGCMTGFSVSACRAIGMYLIKMAAEVAGRTYDMLTALGVMGLFMVLRNPFQLQNSGFLLSFTSVLGIGVVYPLLAPEIPSGQAGTRVSQRRKESKRLSGKENGDSVRGKGGARLGVPWSLFSKLRNRIGDMADGFTDFIQHPEEYLEETGAAVGNALIQSFFASLSITLTTLPVQLWFYYEIPVYSVFLNLFVIPFLKPMMITGLLAMLVPGLGYLGIIDILILGSYEFCCSCFDALPFHTWNPGCPKIWQMVAYYLILGAVLVVKALGRRKKEILGSGAQEITVSLKGAASEGIPQAQPEKAGWKLFGIIHGKQGKETTDSRARFWFRILGACGTTGAIGFGVLLFALRPPAKNSVTFLDVGQGDCILLRTASGENYMFDCGSSSRKKIGKYVLLPYLKYSGIQTLDAVFLSHPDADHINGAVELFALGGENNIAVNQLLLPDIAESAKEEQLGELVQAASEASQPVPVGYLSAGDGWDCGSAVFTCLHPAKGFGGEDVNAYSECFLVEFYEEGGGPGRDAGSLAGQGGTQYPDADWTLLLTGDVQDKGEKAFFQEIKDRGISGITVLKAAHHGSRNSTPRELLEQLDPILTVISSGRNNRYGHPHKELMERLGECGTAIAQTAQSGAVTVAGGDGGIVVRVAVE